jgi:hypothetical protein
MELAIPLTKFIPTNVRWGTPRSGAFRRTIPFLYEDNQTTFTSLVLVLQPLRIVEYDADRNQLVLEDVKRTPTSFNKLELLQTTVAQALDKYTRVWLDGTPFPKDGAQPIQPWVRNRRITIHLSSQKELMPMFGESGRLEVNTETLKPGTFLRLVVKLQGLSLQMSADDVWTGKSRIQHHVLQMYQVDPATTVDN